MKVHNIVLLFVVAVGWALFPVNPAVVTAANSMSDYTSDPPFAANNVSPNVMLDMSVESPMEGAAYNDQNDTANGGSCSGRVSSGGVTCGACYFPATTYYGIFDPDKCYSYSTTLPVDSSISGNSSVTTGGFVPAATANSDHSCPAGGYWSGNFLNWSTMTAIDEFRWVLTGGNRVYDKTLAQDSTTQTVLRRANDALAMDDSWFPRKVIGSGVGSGHTVSASSVTPYSDSTIYIYNHGYQMDVGNSTSSSHNKAQNLNVQVKVCDASQGLEDNCVSYGSYYKPQGLIQNNAIKMKFALMSYLYNSNQSRNGGVLRANMKYVGPTIPGGTANTNKEFSIDGTFVNNPNPTDAANSGVPNSGIINYVNKFGANGYKAYDPVGELYYECLRYFKHLGPTPEDSSSLQSGENDNFPVITSWNEPIQDDCQKNYIVAINDANPWLDKTLPGTNFMTSTFKGQSLIAGDYGQPSNADTTINVKTWTNKVGDAQHENLINTYQCIGCTATTCDWNATKKLIPNLGEIMGTCPYPGKQNSYYIAGLAYYAHTTDLRPELNFAGKQTVTTYMIDTQEYTGTYNAQEYNGLYDTTDYGSNPLIGHWNMLWLAAKWGGFDDTYGDGTIHDASQWDKDGDGQPDNYVLASDPLKLKNGLTKAFTDILRRASSGTAASVVSNTRSGEGAVYQSIFYPYYSDTDCAQTVNPREVNWIGDVHALLVDSYGNMREDTNQNGKLDLSADNFIIFNGTDVYRLPDANGNGQLDVGDYTDTNGNGQLDTSELTSQFAGSKCTLKDIKYLWSSSQWLNSITNANITTQRSTYITDSRQRYLFTFLDTNGNMVPGSGEIVPFTSGGINRTNIMPYIHLFPPFAYNASSPPPGVKSTDFSTTTYQNTQADRIINYIRGQDQGPSTSVGTSILPAMRSRQVDYTCSGTPQTMRQGDIVDSTPTLVAAPAENLDLLYNDMSYSDFAAFWKNRRNVVYAGANDGIFHAYNGGFYDSTNKQFWKKYDTSANTFSNPGTGAPDLGAELWGYIPFNLLPHLYWLTDPTYTHVYYADLKPRVFDAKVFTADTTAHINGWGTILVAGMRLGGGKIGTDKDHNGSPGTGDQQMQSAYFIFDITDPENTPKLLAEISFPDLGFTTSYPTVIPMVDNSNASSYNWVHNYYLALGSGPNDGANGADATALANVSSGQPAMIYMIDLKQLVQNSVLKDQKGTALTSTSHTPFVTLPLATDANSFIGDMITVDTNLNYKANAVYFGTQSGSSPNWAGKMRRIVINDNLDPTTWVGNSVLLDAGRPITAAPSSALDTDGRLWVYFGTGRFMIRDDINYTATQTFYGIKEPVASGALTWGTVSNGTNLLNTSNTVVYEGGNISATASPSGTLSTFNGLLTQIKSMDGWRFDFPGTGERCLGQAAVLGEMVTFTTYTPSSDPCAFEGTSNLYGLFYTSGTAYDQPVMGYHTGLVDANGNKAIENKISMGLGMTTTPNVHVGREQGSKAYIQSSTGAILTVPQLNPGVTKSGSLYWKEKTN